MTPRYVQKDRRNSQPEEIGLGRRGDAYARPVQRKSLETEGRARRSRKRRKKRAAIAFLCLLLFLLFIPLCLRLFVLSPVRITGEGMSPAVEGGAVVLLNKTAYLDHPVRRFDVVLCKINGKAMFRRVIGLPGEMVQIERGIVYVNGRVIRERADTLICVENFGPLQVPKGEYFVLGDNRPVSMDSRGAGTIKKSKIYGKAERFAYPFDKFWQSVDE